MSVCGPWEEPLLHHNYNIMDQIKSFVVDRVSQIGLSQWLRARLWSQAWFSGLGWSSPSSASTQWPSLILQSPCCYLALVYVLSPVPSPSLLPVAPALLSLSVNPVRAHGIKAFRTGTIAVSKSFDLGCAHELRAEWGSQCHVKISFGLQDVLSVYHSRHVSSPPC